MAETVHTHDEAVTTSRPFTGVMVARTILTLAGAAALVIAVFQPWIHGANGDTLAFEAYWKMDPATDVNFWQSAGLVALGCAIVGVLGLMTLSGWITRLAGAVAIIAFGLIVVELARANATLPNDIGAGLWWMLGGGVVMLIGSLVVPPAPTTTTTT
jgi:hypothetical protein